METDTRKSLVGRGYEDLGIQDGMAAVVKWKEAIDPTTPRMAKTALERQLLAYCGRDTQLMHEIIESVRTHKASTGA